MKYKGDYNEAFQILNEFMTSDVYHFIQKENNSGVIIGSYIFMYSLNDINVTVIHAITNNVFICSMEINSIKIHIIDKQSLYHSFKMINATKKES